MKYYHWQTFNKEVVAKEQAAMVVIYIEGYEIREKQMAMLATTKINKILSNVDFYVPSSLHQMNSNSSSMTSTQTLKLT